MLIDYFEDILELGKDSSKKKKNPFPQGSTNGDWTVTV